jgi:hypothetical protein
MLALASTKRLPGAARRLTRYPPPIPTKPFQGPRVAQRMAGRASMYPAVDGSLFGPAHPRLDDAAAISGPKISTKAVLISFLASARTSSAMLAEQSMIISSCTVATQRRQAVARLCSTMLALSRSAALPHTRYLVSMLNRAQRVVSAAPLDGLACTCPGERIILCRAFSAGRTVA